MQAPGARLFSHSTDTNTTYARSLAFYHRWRIGGSSANRGGGELVPAPGDSVTRLRSSSSLDTARTLQTIMTFTSTPALPISLSLSPGSPPSLVHRLTDGDQIYMHNQSVATLPEAQPTTATGARNYRMNAGRGGGMKQYITD